ncbi:Rv1733c family protein [Rhodococcus opacus]|uniref:Rv1733c family protein n=1 Tax=Rhodococcus opacus TaxID=37919 RepID=UPI0002A35A13|nr:hypothetical protein [Rhodococcus opacus]ELB94982.1 hypothetical protein Rwratislav_01082 [Rhodococcus wratislaviensis IFP 2016]MDX5970090.1 hypothetical protein [Rhodococcus opacus]CAG7633949.1 hypothetical protein E143388_07553 [Rhodococcus opacus]
MSGEQAAPVRWWRLAPWSGNRLMRGSDRFESSALLVVVMLVLLLVPVAAAVGTATNTRLGDQARADRESRHETTAVLLEDPRAESANVTWSPESTFHAPAAWIIDGTTRTGQVQTDAGAKTGHTVSVWIDQSGNLVDAPKTGAENAVTAVSVALAVWTSSAAILMVMLFGIHWAEARYRILQWDREWRNLGKAPGWPVS